MKHNISDIVKTLNKLSVLNIDQVLKYANMLLNIQENTLKKEQNTYNHRRYERYDGETCSWNYMTKDILDTHKKRIENQSNPSCYDLLWRSRFEYVNVTSSYNNSITIFGEYHNKVVVADYIMFNPFFKLTYELVDRFLCYCKIQYIDNSAYNVDGWMLERNMYNTPNYTISHCDSNMNDMVFVSTDEDKGKVVRLLICVMNETPEQYVNIHNYQVLSEWYYNNEVYLDSYQGNINADKKNKENRKLEEKQLSPEELIVALDDKLTVSEITNVLLYHTKYGKKDMMDMSIVEEQSSGVKDDMVKIDTKHVDLSDYYEYNGYTRTNTVIDELLRMSKNRVNCNNYPKTNGQLITKSELLCGMYNLCKPFGMGIFHNDNTSMTIEDAEHLLSKTTYIDYYKGCAMKMSFSTFPIMNFERFDKRNGQGTFMECIEKLQNNSQINKETLSKEHMISEIKRMSKLE